MKNMKVILENIREKLKNKPDKNVDDSIFIEYLDEIISKMNEAINWSESRYGRDKR